MKKVYNEITNTDQSIFYAGKTKQDRNVSSYVYVMFICKVGIEIKKIWLN